MSRSVVAAVATLAILSTAPAQTQSPPADDPPSRTWKRLRSKSFTAIGDASEREMRDALRELEAHRLARLDLVPWLVPSQPEAVTLIVFNDRSHLARVAPRDELNRSPTFPRSFGVPSSTGTYLVLSEDLREDRNVAFKQPLWHYMGVLLGDVLPNAPLWLRSGLSELFANFVPLAPSSDRDIGPPQLNLRQVTGSIVSAPLDKVISATTSPGGTFAVTSWRLVHYLLLGSAARSQQLPQYLTLIERGVASREAFTTAFGPSLDEFQREFMKYGASPAWRIAAKTLDDTVAAVRTEPLRESEVAAVLGELSAASGRDEEALKQLDAALARDSRSVSARQAKALVLRNQGRDAEAFALIDRIDQSASSLNAHLALGETLNALGRYSEALDHYRRAAGMKPRSLHAWRGVSVSSTAIGRFADADIATKTMDRWSASPHWRYSRSIELMRVPNAEPQIIRDAQVVVDHGDWDRAAYPVFLAALSHLRLGRRSEADALLANLSAHLPKNSWPWRVTSFLQGEVAASALLDSANNDGERTEAHAYIGLVASSAGHIDEAMPHFKWVVDHQLRSYTEYHIVLNEMRRLGRTIESP